MTKEVSESSNLIFETYLGEKGTAVSTSSDGSVFAVGTISGRIFLFGRLGNSWKSYLVPFKSDGEILGLKLLSRNVVCFTVSNNNFVNFVSWEDELLDVEIPSNYSSPVSFKKLISDKNSVSLETSFGRIHTFDIAQHGRLCWLGYSGSLVSAKIRGVGESSSDSFSLSDCSSFSCSPGMVFALNSRQDGRRVIYSTSDSTSLHILDIDSSKQFFHTSYRGHDDWITALKIVEENENLLLSGDSSGQVCFWDSRCANPLVGIWDFFRSIAGFGTLNNPWRMLLAFGPHDDYIIEDEIPLHCGVLFSCVDLRTSMLQSANGEHRTQGSSDEISTRHIVSSSMDGDQVVAMDMDVRKSRVVYITNDGYIRVTSRGLFEEQFDQLLPRLSRRELGFSKWIE